MIHVTNEHDDRSPMAQAMEWTSQVTTIAVEMALPGLGGHWLDRRLGTGMVFLLVGVALGFAMGMWHLLKLTQGASERKTRKKP
jgi:hypothetical protein